MTQPDHPVGAATPFEDVDVDHDVARDGPAPEGGDLTSAETDAIDEQIAEITAVNQNRTPGEQISIAAEDVS